MGPHSPFEDLKHKLWLKEWLGVNLTIWLPISKTQEIGVKWPSIGAYNMALENSFQWWQFFLLELFNWNFYVGVMSLQSYETCNW